MSLARPLTGGPPRRRRAPRMLLDQCRRVEAYLTCELSLDDAEAALSPTFRSEQWRPDPAHRPRPHPKARPTPKEWGRFEIAVDQQQSAWPLYMVHDIPLILSQMPRDLQRLYVLHYRSTHRGTVQRALEQGRHRTTIYRQRQRVLEHIAYRLWDDHYQPAYLSRRSDAATRAS